MAKLKMDRIAQAFGHDSQERKEVIMIPIATLKSFKDHPFHLYTMEKMNDMVESVRESGIINPLIVRTAEDGFYEIIAGHNRWEAAKRLGIEKVPAIVEELDDDRAAIMMVDTNFNQRDEILPSEKAFAYKIKLDAIKRQGERNDLTSLHSENKYDQERTSLHSENKLSAEKIGAVNKESMAKVYRYIRLTKLIPSLLSMVDAGELGFIAAVDISYLSKNGQGYVSDCIRLAGIRPNKEQAAELKKQCQSGELSKEKVERILMMGKYNKLDKWKIEQSRFCKYLPSNLVDSMDSEMAEKIFEEAMGLWREKYEREHRGK